MVIFPALSSPTRFPMEVKKAFIIVTLFATIYSASPRRIKIRRITSNLISSRMSILSEQNPITKNRTTREEPTATNMGSMPAMTFHGPPPLNASGDCPRRSKIREIWLFQNPNTASSRARILSPQLKNIHYSIPPSAKPVMPAFA